MRQHSNSMTVSFHRWQQGTQQWNNTLKKGWRVVMVRLTICDDELSNVVSFVVDGIILQVLTSLNSWQFKQRTNR